MVVCGHTPGEGWWGVGVCVDGSWARVDKNMAGREMKFE